MPNNVVKLISTFFYIGYFPVGPGTVASAVGMGLALMLKENIFIYVLLFLVITILGFLVSEPMEKLVGHPDPGCIVIDEVAGVMIAFFMLPINFEIGVVTFFLFRAFDMFKIYPVNKFEDIHGGIGVMMDDIIAGVYTNITMQVAVRFAGII